MYLFIPKWVICALLPCSASYSQPKRKVTPTSSEKLPTALRWDVSILCPGSKTKQSAHASSQASPVSIYGTEWGTGNIQECSGNKTQYHPTSKGIPNCLALAPGIWKRSPLLPSTSSCKEASTSVVHPKCTWALQCEKRAENAHLQSCLPEEHLEDLFGRFFLQISFQVITDLAMGHLANPQRTQIKTPCSPAP